MGNETGGTPGRFVGPMTGGGDGGPGGKPGAAGTGWANDGNPAGPGCAGGGVADASRTKLRLCGNTSVSASECRSRMLTGCGRLGSVISTRTALVPTVKSSGRDWSPWASVAVMRPTNGALVAAWRLAAKLSPVKTAAPRAMRQKVLMRFMSGSGLACRGYQGR